MALQVQSGSATGMVANSGKQIRSAEALPSDSSLVRRIVVPVSGADRDFEVQQWAVALANSLGVPVSAFHVAPPGKDGTKDTFKFIRRDAEKWRVALDTQVLHADDIAAEILAEVGPMDLIVMGTQNMGGRYHLGSVAAQIVNRAPCPVQLVRLK